VTEGEKQVILVRVPPSFLVAERDPSLRQVLAEITAENFPSASIYSAGDETEAVATLPRLRPPCVAILHWSLLAQGSATLSLFHAAGVPVLLTSAWDPATIEEAGPASGKLKKPFELHEYVATLNDLLASWPAPGTPD
jgi:DNA-binding response OmpR family regulator